jgi:hypothetical protein
MVNNEFKDIEKKSSYVQTKASSYHLEEMRKTTKSLWQDSSWPKSDSNQVFPE